MKTLSFDELKIGRSVAQTLIDVDTSRDGIALSGGLHLLVAPNGYGKTSYFQTIAGLLHPLSGAIRLDGKKFEPQEHVFYVSEYLTFPKFIYPHEWTEFHSGKRLEENDPWVSCFRMREKMPHFLGRMSQGERRKVTWLAANLSEKPVLLMDEPLDGLDLLAIRCARDLIASWKKQGRIVFIVAHQVGELLDLADQILLIRDRRLVRFEDTGETRNSPPRFRERMLEIYSAR